MSFNFNNIVYCQGVKVKTVKKIKKIDCSTAQEAFASKLKNKPQTYFFNGKWGSGKTTFIKDMAKSHDIRLIEINLWKTDAKGSIFAHAFRKLHPLVFYMMIISLLALFIMSSLAMKNSILVLIAISAVALGKYLLPTPDDFYLGLLKMTRLPLLHKIIFPHLIFNFSPYSWLGLRFIKQTHQNVILFDDFDRAKPKQQEQAYILFTILKERYKIPIVFVGDYSKIESVNDEFIQKIIDERIELPYDLEPQNLWNIFYPKFCQRLDMLGLNFKMDNNFRKYYENFNPSLRNQEQYYQYIEDELFTLNLYDCVNINQKLVIIFLYLFDYEKYLLIKNKDIDSLRTTHYKEFLDKYENKYDAMPVYPLDDIGDIAYSLLSSNGKNQDFNTFPPVFNIDPERYFMNQQTNNLTTSEAIQIIFDSNELKKRMLVNKIDDFYRFVILSLNKNDDILLERLKETALELFEQNKEGKTLQVVLHHMVMGQTLNNITGKLVQVGKGEYFDIILDLSIEHIKLKRPITALNKDIGFKLKHANYRELTTEHTLRTERVLSEWIAILEAKHLGTEMKIVFLKEILHYSTQELINNLDSKLTLNNIVYFENYTDILLNYLLNLESKFNKFSEWDDSVWNIIDSMNISQHINFWTQHNLFHQSDIFTEDASIYVYFNFQKFSDEVTEEEKTTIIKLINKMKTIPTLSASKRIVWPECGNEIMYL